jgi:hypothetical protein
MAASLLSKNMCYPGHNATRNALRWKPGPPFLQVGCLDRGSGYRKKVRERERNTGKEKIKEMSENEGWEEMNK